MIHEYEFPEDDASDEEGEGGGPAGAGEVEAEDEEGEGGSAAAPPSTAMSPPRAPKPADSAVSGGGGERARSDSEVARELDRMLNGS